MGLLRALAQPSTANGDLARRLLEAASTTIHVTGPTSRRDGTWEESSWGGRGVSSRVVSRAGGASGGARRVGGPFSQHFLHETRHRPVRLQDRVHVV